MILKLIKVGVATAANINQWSILFVFWLVQFAVPSIREEMIWAYAIWCGIEIVMMLFKRQAPAAWIGLRKTWTERFATGAEG